MNPLLAGVGAAIAWGIGDYAGGLATRRIPALWTSIGMQAIGTALFAAALAILGIWPSVDAAVVPWGAGLAVLGAFSLLLLYRGLALGPIAVVSPVVAGYTAVTVLLVVVFLGERLSELEAVMIALTFAGVLLASTDIRRVLAIVGRPLPGVPAAFLAMLGFGAWGALMALATREHDGMALILVGRVTGLAIMAATALVTRTGLPADRRAVTLGLVAVVGVFDTIANVLFVIGVASGAAAIVATASGLYPVLPAILAIVFLGERLAPNQYVGVLVIVGGLVGLGAVRGS